MVKTHEFQFYCTKSKKSKFLNFFRCQLSNVEKKQKKIKMEIVSADESEKTGKFLHKKNCTIDIILKINNRIIKN